jgi:glycine/D-amino acid oxidase-like deaminating enzyme
MAGPAPGVLIVGGGLAGALLALELRRRGVAVTVLEASPGPAAPSATAWSYGVIPGLPLAPTPLARAAAASAARWRQLQRRHGDLGWQPVRARLLGGAAEQALLARLRLLPLSQVDPGVLLARLPELLAAAGVRWLQGRAMGLEPLAAAAGWRVLREGGEPLQADQLVLAAGAGCRRLWPALPAALQCSWAGVLELPPPGGAAATGLLLPGRFARLALERRSALLSEPAWVVDAGLVPRRSGLLVGQLSWIAPACADRRDGTTAPEPAPEPRQAEAWLRQAIAAGDPRLARCLQLGPARYRQVPVAFSRDGLPWAAPLAGAPGLWLFSGFSGGFAQVPLLAPLLAAAITAERQGPGPATRELQRLGVWPAAAGA